MTRARLLSGLLLAALAAAGCSASDTASTASYGEAPKPGVNQDAAREDSAGEGTGSGQPTDAKAARIDQPGVERKLIRTASLSLTVGEVGPAVFDARAIATAAGGYTGNLQVERSYATITLHVPSDRLDPVVQQLSKLGEVGSSTQTAEDVTEQLVDVDSRIETQRASLDRVRALLAKATSIDDIVRVESEVTRREADLESLLKRRETLSGQVALSTVTVSLRAESAPAPAPEEDEGLGAAFADGWSAFTGAVAAVLEALARMLPFLVLVIALGVGAWVRWGRPRRRAAREVPAEG
ncbi:DUF4349 domain-containing protein [Actinokineospora soli]|uniref:DUF4349 domain-containing protein n=1 Tax=Actinokineospora soli TaxID=1048753 RepID=A0ABW2TW67_9PSEU